MGEYEFFEDMLPNTDGHIGHISRGGEIVADIVNYNRDEVVELLKTLKRVEELERCDQCNGTKMRESGIECACGDGTMKGLVADMRRVLQARLTAIQDIRLERDTLGVAVSQIEMGVNKLWKSVQDGMHDSRSLVGDVTLNMAEALKEIGYGQLRERDNANQG